MLAGYCAGWSLRQLLEQGFGGVPGAISSGPPKHLSSALGQMVNFLGTLQNEWAGAQAFSSFDTYLAPFVRLDNLDYSHVRQCMQEFIFNLNVPSAVGQPNPLHQPHLRLDLPRRHRRRAIPSSAATCAISRYGDLAEEMALINRAFIDVMAEGDADGRVFTFPIPTYNITRDFDWDSPNAHALFDMTAQLRAALLPELHQLRPESRRHSLHVLPPPA